MKICIFNSFYPLVKGGAEYQAKIIAGQLRLKYDVFFISYHHDEDKIINIDGYKVYCIKQPNQTDRFSLYYLINKKICRILNEEKVDIIYQRILNSFTFHLAKYVNKEKRKLIVHIADNYSLLFSVSLSSMIRRCFFVWIKHYYFRGRVQFITQTDFQSELLQKKGIMPVLKLRNMHPIPIKENVSCSFNRIKIIWIGSFRPVKQLELYLEIAKSNVLNTALDFIIVGRANGDYYSNRMLALIKKLSNVTYMGELPNASVNTLLSNSFLLINTSASEGFSNTFIQAWLYGVPVISLNSDPDYFLSKYKLGKVAYGNLDTMNALLLAFIRDRNLYKEYSDRCKNIARKEFSIDANIPKLLKIL